MKQDWDPPKLITTMHSTPLAGLHSEQLALVDLLVLTRTARFVGHQRSTFSITANDLRVIREGADLVSGKLIDQYNDPALSLLPV